MKNLEFFTFYFLKLFIAFHILGTLDFLTSFAVFDYILKNFSNLFQTFLILWIFFHLFCYYVTVLEFSYLLKFIYHIISSSPILALYQKVYNLWPILLKLGKSDPWDDPFTMFHKDWLKIVDFFKMSQNLRCWNRKINNL